MNIKFIKSPIPLGYAYRAGQGAGSLPDHVAQKMIDDGYAILIEKKERPKEVKPEVKTTQITRARKRKDEV
jgi:hypothetical protein